MSPSQVASFASNRLFQAHAVALQSDRELASLGSLVARISDADDKRCSPVPLAGVFESAAAAHEGHADQTLVAAPFVLYSRHDDSRLRRDVVHDTLLSALTVLCHAPQEHVYTCSREIWTASSNHIDRVFSSAV